MAEPIKLPELNRVLIVGRLTADPEHRSLDSGQEVARLRIAHNRRFRDRDGEWRVDESFFRVTAWGQLAAQCQQWLGKGQAVLVEGRLRDGRWTTPEGEARSMTEIVAGRIQFLSSRGGNHEDSAVEGVDSEQESLDDLEAALAI